MMKKLFLRGVIGYAGRQTLTEYGREVLRFTVVLLAVAAILLVACAIRGGR